jgi:transposase
MNIVTVGIDLARNLFASHGVGRSGQAALVKAKVARSLLLALVARM